MFTFKCKSLTFLFNMLKNNNFHLFLNINLLLIYCTNFIDSGANNLHMLDGITTQDVIAGDVFFEIIDPVELEYTYRLRPAKDFGTPFNASFKLSNIALVPTIPYDACKSIFSNADNIRGNVALVERGECSFLSKAINVEKIGALAVIITEAENSIPALDSDYYIEMVHDNTSRETNIPAGFLLGKNGRAIKRILGKLNRNYAIINLPVNLTFTPPHMINHPPWLGW